MTIESRWPDDDGPLGDDDPAAEASTKVRWGLPDALLAFVVGLLLSNLLGGIALAAIGGPDQALPVQVPGLVGLWLGLAGVPVLISRYKGTGSLAEDFGLRLDLRRDVPIGLAVGVASQFLLVPLVFLPFRAISPDLDVGQQARDLAGQPGDAAFFVRIVAFVVCAPFVEELFFRGVLQRALVRRLGVVAGIVICAAVFGLTHFQPLETVALAALLTALAVFGGVLSILAHRSGRLGPALVAHAAFNACTLAALAIF